VIASADTPTCPDAPPAYDGPDDVVRELRQARRDAAAACAVAHADAESAQGSAQDAHDDAVEAAASTGRVEAAVQALPGTHEKPAHVAQSGNWTVDTPTDPDSPQNAERLEALKASAEDQRTATWSIFGLAIGLFFGYFLLRLVMPRA
jgi:uncharacterized membrane protein